MNGIEKITDLFVMVCILFVLPLMFYEYGRNVVCHRMAGQVSESFLRTVSVAGEITDAVWVRLEKALAGFGCYNYEIVRSRILYEPTGGNGAVTEKKYIANHEKIHEQVRETGRSRLQNGDRISITLYFGESPTVYSKTVRTGKGGQ